MAQQTMPFWMFGGMVWARRVASTRPLGGNGENQLRQAVRRGWLGKGSDLVRGRIPSPPASQGWNVSAVPSEIDFNGTNCRRPKPLLRDRDISIEQHVPTSPQICCSVARNAAKRRAWISRPGQHGSMDHRKDWTHLTSQPTYGARPRDQIPSSQVLNVSPSTANDA
jgi:hypothetical protein